MNEDEQREALMRFAKSVGDAASGLTLAGVAMAAAFKECTEALDRFAVAAREKPDDAD